MRILYIDIDTLRPDHMGAYGCPKATTPHLDALAAQSLRFDRVYCSDAPCLPSRAALISGRFGIRNGAVGHGGTAADRRLTGAKRDFTDIIDESSFTHLFRRAGYHTASISTFAERHSSHWFTAGFHEVINVGGHGGESGEEVLPLALDWLNRRGAEDQWYLHLHLWDPHTPYRTPGEDYFHNSEPPAWLTEDVFRRHLSLTGPHGLLEQNMYDDHADPAFPKQPGKVTEYHDLWRIFDGYDNGVRYADYCLGQVLDKLNELGVAEDTAVILTSDRGENLGELGIYSEHGTADEATCHIPLIIKWPGCTPGSDDGLRYQLDLVPTMAELLGLPVDPDWDGVSFAPALKNQPCSGRDALILSQMAHVCQRSARFGDWLYLRSVHDGYHLLDRELLFHLTEDPHEQHDCKDQHPELCDHGARLILNWQEEQMARSAYPVDPMWTVMAEGGPSHTVGALPEYLAYLEKTGRADAADELRKKYPGAATCRR